MYVYGFDNTDNNLVLSFAVYDKSWLSCSYKSDEKLPRHWQGQATATT